MTDIVCDQKSCMYRDCDGRCLKMSVRFEKGVCAEFECVTESPEYSSCFYALVKERDKIYRDLRRGKRIEFNGFAFYTTEPIFENDSHFVYEERTGYLCGSFAFVKKNFDLVADRLKEKPDAAEYPVVREGDQQDDENTEAVKSPILEETADLLKQLTKKFGAIGAIMHG